MAPLRARLPLRRRGPCRQGCRAALPCELCGILQRPPVAERHRYREAILMGSFDLAEFPAGELVHLFRRGEASPVEATRAALARIERCNARYNAFCLIDAEHALAAAAAAEERWRKSEPR